MPIRVRCPHPDCRKYNLVDDALRGKKVHCLICQRPMPAAEASGSTISKAVAGGEFVVKQCPKCNSKLKIPAEAAHRRVKCSKCGEVFD